MPVEAALNLSIPELLRALNEKLGPECTRVREISLPPLPASITCLGAEVSTSIRSISISASAVVGSNAQSSSSKASKPEHTKF